MKDDVISLFEGLTPSQARAFEKLILPTLRNLRADVIWLDEHADEIAAAAKELEASHD